MNGFKCFNESWQAQKFVDDFWCFSFESDHVHAVPRVVIMLWVLFGDYREFDVGFQKLFTVDL